MKFHNVGRAAAEIGRLEQALGIESDGAKHLYIHKANARIAELETQLAAKAILTTVVSPAAPPEAATKTAAPQLSRRQCLAVMQQVFEESPMAFASLSDSDLLADTLARCQAALLRLPGEPPVDCSALSNYAKVIRGQRQDRLTQITGLVGMARIRAAAKADLDAAGYVPKH